MIRETQRPRVTVAPASLPLCRLASGAPLSPRRRSFENSFETQSEPETRDPGRTGLLSSSRIDITDHPRWIITIETQIIIQSYLHLTRRILPFVAP
jgi:hypothetical protein